MSNLEELGRRNAEIFNNVVKEQNKKILDQQIQINGLVNTISSLQERLNLMEQKIIMLQVKMTGNGPSSI